MKIKEGGEIDFRKMRKERTPQAEIVRLQTKVDEFTQRLELMRAEGQPQRLIDGIVGRRRQYIAEIKAWEGLL